MSTKELEGAAKALISAGIQPVYTLPNKRPRASWRHLADRAEPSAQDIGRAAPGGGIGAVCGIVSGGLEVLDFDVPGKSGEPPAWAPWEELLSGHDPDLLARLAIASTPSGGRHVYFRSPTPEGNRKLARMREHGAEAVIETRGQGGYAVCPPSPGYAWLQCGPESIPMLDSEERELLIALALRLDTFEDEPSKSARQSAPTHPNGERPGDDFNARTTWRELLEAEGWAFHHEAQGAAYWTRPGKAKRDGTSATTNYAGSDLLKVFTTNAHPLSSEKTYDRFGFYAAVHHAGDLKAAARALGKQGYGKPQEPPKLTGEGAPQPSAEQRQEPRIITSRTLEDWSARLAAVKDPLTTGCAPIDRLAPIPRQGITIIAGRPGHGKTTVLLNIARSLCERGERVLLFSYEESWAVLAAKMLLARARVTPEGVEHQKALFAYLRFLAGDGALTPTAAEHILKEARTVAGWLESGQLAICDEAPGADSLAETMRENQSRYPTILIDYAQKVRPPEGRYASRMAEIQAASEVIRQTAKDTGQAVIMAAQFNREGSKEGKMAQLHHLRECGDLEQDAQLVIGVHNHAAADQDAAELTAGEVGDGDPFGDSPATLMTLYVLKARQGGQVGAKLEAKFEGQYYYVGEAVAHA